MANPLHDFVIFHDLICSTATLSINPLSSAALYGKGIFTTIAINDGKPFLWEKHWQRMQGDAAKVGIHMWEYPEETVTTALIGLIEKNNVKSGRARITFFDERGGDAWPADTGRETTLLINTGDPRPAPENLRLTVSPYPVNSRSPLAGIKSCNYLENLLALNEAQGRGFDEAVRLNERGEIASACMANIFWRKEGKLYTPTLATGCLAGTTRGYVIEKLGAVEIVAGPDALETADAIILTSAGLGVVEAAEWDGRKLEGLNYDLRKF